ncbi:MAG: hypothetical protein M3R71_04075 [Actinomycetota bacterium]|nr:hypothetical protein [Actinomycetota bacterium]
MSTLWTPDGERPIPRSPATPPPAPSEPRSSGPGVAGRSPADAGPNGSGGDNGGPDEELSAEEEAHLEQMRDELARIPPEVIIANHAYGLFQLAAVHLSLQPPQLAEARTAIDAFASLVEGMPGRLGDAEAELVAGLAQLRLTFVQVRGGGTGPG